LDRNAIINAIKSSYASYSSTDSRSTVEKVLKYSGDSFDLIQRSDIKSEVVVFRLLGGNTDYLVSGDKPVDLIQQFQAIVYIEQSDSHSIKEARYDRMLEISDQLMDWANEVVASSINSSLDTLTFTGVDQITEQDGYLSTVVNFESIIQIS
jgi:hypothetical protein